VAEYLAGVAHDRLARFGPLWEGPAVLRAVGGERPEAPPADLDFWVAEASGTGTQVVDWRPADGNWTAVVMRADGAAGVAVEARIGATAPGLGALAAGLLAVGAALLVAGALMVALAVRSAQSAPGGPSPVPAGPPPGPEPASEGPAHAEVPGPRTAERQSDSTQRS
jgi:hypothetical protein